MKNRKIMIVGIVLILICISIFLYFSFFRETTSVQEILPEEEITDEQYRKTMVSLYYKNKNSQELMPEVRLIDVKILVNEPYLSLINLLIEQPKNENLQSTIPEGTKVNKVELKSDILWIDFSKEFIDNHPGGIEEETKTISSLVNTLTELTEVNGIKILIDNEENKSFKDNNINFNNPFFKIDSNNNIME